VTDPVRQIADAVLYEGYILWPYRRSALKNQQRWTFGGVYPRAHSLGREDDPWEMRTECLVEGAADARVDVTVRFLHVVRRGVVRRTADGEEPVEELIVDGERHLSWDEALERELQLPELRLDRNGAGARAEIAIDAGDEREELVDQAGERAGALLRHWEQLEGEVELRVDRVAGVHRITVRIANTSPCPPAEPRDEVLRRALCSTHTVLRATGGEFVSMTDPPERLAAAAAACHNAGTWPVLVGEQGARSTILSSPIILEDHPRIAPESPGDLFDSGEVDQLLVLNILSLTDEEKAEMRASDPRAREILERTEALSEEEMMRLHGAIREFGVVRG
jgi:hypothetical protein